MPTVSLLELISWPSLPWGESGLFGWTSLREKDPFLVVVLCRITTGRTNRRLEKKEGPSLFGKKSSFLLSCLPKYPVLECFFFPFPWWSFPFTIAFPPFLFHFAWSALFYGKQTGETSKEESRNVNPRSSLGIPAPLLWPFPKPVFFGERLSFRFPKKVFPFPIPLFLLLRSGAQIASSCGDEGRELNDEIFK